VSMNADAGLSLGSNAVMNHLGPFLLILLCYLAKPLYTKGLWPFNYFLCFFSMFSYIVEPLFESRKLSYEGIKLGI
jgi:hypothetical protein